MSLSGNKINKAMILAAGFGTRLRPLTLKTPKPLLPVKGIPLIDHNLIMLKNAGVQEVVINLHYLGEQIRNHVGKGEKYGLKINFLEEKEILGTGGAIKNAEGFLNDGPFFVVNSDVYSEVDLKKIVAYFFQNQSKALMVVRRLQAEEEYAHINVINETLQGFGSGTHMFTGISVFDPIIFNFLEKPSCLIESGYKKLLANKITVSTYEFNGYWNDVGTIDRYNGLI